MDLVPVLVCIFVGAALYTSVGHGGATVYTAILTLFGFAIAPLVLEGSRGAIEKAMLEAARRVEDWPRVRKRLTREHGAILDAVLAKDGTAASRHMSRHIRRFYEDVALSEPRR